MIRQAINPHKREATGFREDRMARKWMAMFAFAEALAKLSMDPHRKVGCVVFDPFIHRVWSFGYNGPVTGFPHNVEPPPPYVRCPAGCYIPPADGPPVVSAPCQVCDGSDRPGYIRNPQSSGMQHAEVNTLIRMPTMDVPSLSAICMLTLAPCDTCARHIIQSGVIGLVVYAESYDKFNPDLLTNNGIAVVDLATVKMVANLLPRDSDGTRDAMAFRAVVETLMQRANRQ